VTILLDVELALSESVPELDGSVSGTGNDLTVIGGEGDGENVRGVSNETTGGKSRVEVPKTKGLVPRGGKSELTVRRNDNVRDEVVVSVEDTLGVSERRLFTTTERMVNSSSFTSFLLISNLPSLCRGLRLL